MKEIRSIKELLGIPRRTLFRVETAQNPIHDDAEFAKLLKGRDTVRRTTQLCRTFRVGIGVELFKLLIFIKKLNRYAVISFP